MARLVKRMPSFRRRKATERYYSPTAYGWPASLTLPSIAGVMVTPQTALTYTAYLAGVRVISEDTASLPLAVFRRQPKGGSKLVRGHPITRLFARSPGGKAKEMPSMQWRESWIAHCLGWGNGYAEIEWSKGGEPLSLNLLHPGQTEAKHDENKQLYYEHTIAATMMRGGGVQKIPPYKVLHLAGLGFNGLTGYSPVAAAREAIGLGKAAEQFGASLFGNGAIPKGYLKYPGKLKPEAIANLRASIEALHQGSANANKLAILEEGFDWITTQINPDDAQFLLTRQFQVIEICRILRLPPNKLQDYSQAHLANIEASNLDYLMTTLRPWCVRVEQCIDLKLLTDDEWEAGFYVRHDIRAILRASIKDRAEYYQKMYQFGMSPDEIRELEDMNPIGDDDGGNKRFRPANMVDLTAEIPAPGPNQAPNPPGDPGRPEGSGLDPGSSAFDFGHRNGHFSGQNGVICS